MAADMAPWPGLLDREELATWQPFGVLTYRIGLHGQFICLATHPDFAPHIGFGSSKSRAFEDLKSVPECGERTRHGVLNWLCKREKISEPLVLCSTLPNTE